MPSRKNIETTDPAEALNGMVVLLGWMQQLARDALRNVEAQSRRSAGSSRKKRPKKPDPARGD